MQFLLHRSPFCRQGQIRRTDGEHDTLSALVVFLPQEQPYNFIDISESVKHDKRQFIDYIIHNRLIHV